MAYGIDFVLSEKTLNLHRDYLKKQKLRYSIWEKAFPQISGKCAFEIAKMKIRDKRDIISLKCDIMCHELYFASFGKEYQSSIAARNKYRTESSFLYEIYEKSRCEKQGFLIIGMSGGRIEYTVGEENEILKITNPLLAVDLYEHAYFLDFGFDMDLYLNKILPMLNLSFLDKFLQSKD